MLKRAACCRQSLSFSPKYSSSFMAIRQFIFISDINFVKLLDIRCRIGYNWNPSRRCRSLSENFLPKDGEQGLTIRFCRGKIYLASEWRTTMEGCPSGLWSWS